MKISQTTKSDRANYPNARPNELRCSKEAADYEFKLESER